VLTKFQTFHALLEVELRHDLGGVLGRVLRNLATLLMQREFNKGFFLIIRLGFRINSTILNGKMLSRLSGLVATLVLGFNNPIAQHRHPGNFDLAGRLALKPRNTRPP